MGPEPAVEEALQFSRAAKAGNCSQVEALLPRVSSEISCRRRNLLYSDMLEESRDIVHLSDRWHYSMDVVREAQKPFRAAAKAAAREGHSQVLMLLLSASNHVQSSTLQERFREACESSGCHNEPHADRLARQHRCLGIVKHLVTRYKSSLEPRHAWICVQYIYIYT